MDSSIGAVAALHHPRHERGHEDVRGAEAPQQAGVGLLRLMTALDHVPVLLLGRPLGPGTSFARYLFSSTRRPASGSSTGAHFASAAVGALRFEAGRHPDDRRLAALVAELRAADPDVPGVGRPRRPRGERFADASSPETVKEIHQLRDCV